MKGRDQCSIACYWNIAGKHLQAPCNMMLIAGCMNIKPGCCFFYEENHELSDHVRQKQEVQQAQQEQEESEGRGVISIHKANA